MKSFRRQIQRQQSCQSCLILTLSLKQYSADKTRLTGEILCLQSALIQLKQDVKTLKIENISAENGLKESAKQWQRPENSFYFTTIDDDYELPKSSLSIGSRPPLVRPRKSRHIPEVSIERPQSPPREVSVEVPVIPEEVTDEFDIPRVQSGCDVCASLLSQIRREIGELKLMNKSLAVKRAEIADYQKQADRLERNKHELKRQITKQSNNSQIKVEGDHFELGSPSSFDLYASQSSISDMPQWEHPNGPMRGREYSDHSGATDDQTFSSLLSDYRAGQARMRQLLANQDSIVEQLSELYFQNNRASVSSYNSN